MYSMIMNGNDEPLNSSDSSSEWQLSNYSVSRITRTRVMANTMNVMAQNPEFLSQKVYSYYIVDANEND